MSERPGERQGPSGPPPKAARAGDTAPKPERPAAKRQEREATKRALRSLATAAAGAALALAALAGLSLATEPAAPDAPALDVGGYCRHRHGETAAAYEEADPPAFRCSAWRNGVWGLDPVDPAVVCRWQLGPGARLVRAEATERRLACTL